MRFLLVCLGCVLCGVGTGAAQVLDLNGLTTIRPELASRRASSFDPTGGNIDNVESFAPQATHVLLDVDGPGRVTHLWLTTSTFVNHATYLRDLVVRMYWENSPVPSVEVPLGDFFALGHAKRYTFQSAAVAVGGNPKALNCYWPMPFYRHARIEIHNNGRRSLRRLYYHVDYERGPQPPDQGLFHAVFRRERELKTQAHEGNTTGKDNYVILDTRGQGQYVGCALFVDAQPGGWWGEGDDMIFIDGSDKPVIIGTGSEDYFNNAWGYDEPFSYPYYGCPFLEKRPDGGAFTTVYRWHIPDPIRFNSQLRVTIERIFSGRVVNDYSSVAYWYQRVPITERAPLPVGETNHPRQYPAATQPAGGALELDGTELEPELRARGLTARAITGGTHDGYTNGGWLRIDALSGPIEIPIPVPEDGTWRVQLKPVNHLAEKPVRFGLKGGEPREYRQRGGHEGRVPYLDLGSVASSDRRISLRIESGPSVGLDQFRLQREP